jgi:hypothetical protein
VLDHLWRESHIADHAGTTTTSSTITINGKSMTVAIDRPPGAHPHADGGTGHIDGQPGVIAARTR